MRGFTFLCSLILLNALTNHDAEAAVRSGTFIGTARPDQIEEFGDGLNTTNPCGGFETLCGNHRTSGPEPSYFEVDAAPVVFDLVGNPMIPNSVALACHRNYEFPAYVTLVFNRQNYDTLLSTRTHGLRSPTDQWVSELASPYISGETMNVRFPLTSTPASRVTHICARMEKNSDPEGEPLYVCGAIYCPENTSGVHVGSGADPREIPGGYIPSGNPGMVSGAGGITPQRGLVSPVGASGEGGGFCGALSGRDGGALGFSFSFFAGLLSIFVLRRRRLV